VALDSLERLGKGCGVSQGPVAKRAGESREQPSSALSGKTVTSDLQRVALVENDDGEGGTEGRVQLGRGFHLCTLCVCVFNL